MLHLSPMIYFTAIQLLQAYTKAPDTRRQ